MRRYTVLLAALAVMAVVLPLSASASKQVSSYYNSSIAVSSWRVKPGMIVLSTYSVNATGVKRMFLTLQMPPQLQLRTATSTPRMQTLGKNQWVLDHLVSGHLRTVTFYILVGKIKPGVKYNIVVHQDGVTGAYHTKRPIAIQVCMTGYCH
jgi:hypothetical protein